MEGRREFDATRQGRPSALTARSISGAPGIGVVSVRCASADRSDRRFSQAGGNGPTRASISGRAVSMVMPVNSAMHSRGVMSQPSSPRHSAVTRAAMCSLSTSTPSQSNTTSRSLMLPIP